MFQSAQERAGTACCAWGPLGDSIKATHTKNENAQLSCTKLWPFGHPYHIFLHNGRAQKNTSARSCTPLTVCIHISQYICIYIFVCVLRTCAVHIDFIFKMFRNITIYRPLSNPFLARARILCARATKIRNIAPAHAHTHTLSSASTTTTLSASMKNSIQNGQGPAMGGVLLKKMCYSPMHAAK